MNEQLIEEVRELVNQAPASWPGVRSWKEVEARRRRNRMARRSRVTNRRRKRK